MGKITASITDTVRLIHSRFQAVLLRLLRRGRTCVGPDGRPIVDDQGSPVFKEAGPADLAVVVSYLRLMGARASADDPREKLAGIIERARASGWRPAPGQGDTDEEDS